MRGRVMGISMHPPLNKAEKTSYLFSGIAIMLCLRHILQLLGFSSIASILFIGIYIMTAIYVLVNILRRLAMRQKPLAIAFLLIEWLGVLYFAFILFFQYSAYLDKALTFLLMLPLLTGVDAVWVSKKDAKIFFQGITAVGALLAVLAFVPSGYENDILLLYTLNGNQCGLLYMTVFIGIFVYQSLYKRHFLLYGIMACLLYGCWQTESRTAFLNCVLVIGLSFFLNWKPNWKKKVTWGAMGLFVILPFMVSFLVELLSAEFKVLGVSAWTGRENLWPLVIENLISEPFGFRINRMLYNSYGVDLGAHNAWLSVAWNYSVPVAIIFLASLFKIGKRLVSIDNGRESSILIACFIGGLLHMSFESSLLCGALDYSLYFIWTLLAGSAIMNKQEGSQCRRISR